jgi:hypothetical protein
VTALAPRTRRLVATVALVALAFGATACNAGRPPAATVGSIDISAQRVDDLVAAFEEADPDLAAEQVAGDGEGTYSLPVGANLLSFLMSTAAAASEADDRGLEPASAEEARTSLETKLGGSADSELGPKIVDALPSDTRDWLIDLEAKELALKAELGAEATAGTDQEAQARELYDADPTAFTTICLRLIAVAEADLPDVQARLDAGEDFGDVSADVSIDPELAAARGGDQCALRSQFEQQLDPTAFGDIAGAAEGDVVGPYAYDEEGNVVIVEIRSSSVPPFEEVSEQIIASLPVDDGSAALDVVTSEILAGDDVRVDPRFGRWDAEAGTVVPPSGSSSSSAEG